MKALSVSASDASSIALNLIGFIASDEDRLERFLALSGILLMDLKTRAANPDFQGFVLDYVLQDEALLIDFSTATGKRAENIQLARFALPGATHDI